MPSSRARWRNDKVELRLLIMWRTSSSIIEDFEDAHSTLVADLTASVAADRLHDLRLGRTARARFAMRAIRSR